MNSVEVRGAFKSYGKGKKKTFVLSSLNMTVTPGSIFGLIGSSGCGKTTLLSAILGMIRLDGGSIKVLGLKNKRNKIGHRVGYMPQETALVEELTVRETVYYFGNIFEMDQRVLKERFEMIKRVLELPCDNTRVEECSGGEKRRISFAAAIIHAPELLILDEPTVGLDPILRANIWSFLWNETRTSQLSVIITTHYTMEAQKADRVGLMRQGVLISEDSPASILSSTGTPNLDDAFLSLCIKRESGLETSRMITETTVTDQIFTEKPKVIEPKRTDNKNLFRWQIIKEMTKKHYRKYSRQPALLAFTLIMPAMQLLIFYFIFHEKLFYHIAIVNEEVDFKDCINASVKLPTSDDVCRLEKASCLFLNSFPDTVFFEFPTTYEEGYSRLKHGKVIAFLYIRENFSDPINKFLVSGETFADPYTLTQRSVETFIDKSNMILGGGIKNKIISANEKFVQIMLETCNRSSNYLNSPLTFKRPIFGTEWNAKTFLAHSLVTGFCFFVTACLTITPFITDRKEGFWNRTLLAGVKFQEMVAAQTFAYTIVMALINLEIVAYAGIVYGTVNYQSYLTLYLLLLFMGWCAIFFGMLLSTICPNLIAANTAMFTFVIAMCSMCGLFNPIENMRLIFQILAKILPFTFPAEAVRTIMVKEFGLEHTTVQLGFFLAIGWSVVIIAIGICVLKCKKFSRNT